MISSLGFSQTLERPPQFVLISFDGSKSANFWQESFHLAENVDAQFSYFISGVYFLQKKDRAQYLPPMKKAGSSDIGFAEDNINSIGKRTEFIWQAMNNSRSPMEIGSHVNGHFDGSLWNYQQWTQEFTEFHRLVGRVFNLYPEIDRTFKNEWEDTLKSNVKGFRAPLLAGNMEIITKVLQSFSYNYDASQTLRNKWPYELKPNLWNIGLSRILLAGTTRETIAMDYNIFYGQCNGAFNPTNSGECKSLDDSLLSHFEKQTYSSYVQAFLKNYYGNRAPLSIGHHFSLWNKGIYWKALQRFAISVCQQPEVKCISHIQLVKWLEYKNRQFGPTFLAKLNQGVFDKEGTPVFPKENLQRDLITQSANAKNLNLQSMPKAVQDVMLKGDLPAAHDEVAEEINLLKYRISR